MTPRVAVTGLGVVSPAGNSLEGFWNNLITGRTFTREARSIDTAGYTSRQAGEVEDPIAGVPGAPEGAQLGRAARLALGAADGALQDAGLDPEAITELGSRAGVSVGVVVASRPEVEPHVRAAHASGCVPRWEHSRCHHESPARAIARTFGVGGDVVALPDACAAGNTAIALACERIVTGRADVMIAGGADQLSPAMFMMFSQYDALSRDVVRPFDRKRRGLILSEAAALLVLEREDHARARGARIHGYVAGYGMVNEAHDMTFPEPQGRGVQAGMERALRSADLRASDIDYVCAHGTGTLANDLTEAKAIARVLGASVGDVAVSSLKGSLGHSQGAAAAVESLAILLAMRHGRVPPNANLREADADNPLDLVTGGARTVPVKAALNCAAGFGGNVCCVALVAP